MVDRQTKRRRLIGAAFCFLLVDRGQAAAVGSILTPGPMVEETATFLM